MAGAELRRAAPPALVLAGLALVFAFSLHAPAAARSVARDLAVEEPPASAYQEAIDVSLLTLLVRVVDTWGNPILGLEAEDFEVRAGKLETPVLALDWIGAGAPVRGAVAMESLDLDRAAAGTGGEGAAGTAPLGGPATPGRLMVVFVQADLHPTRISGQLRLRPHTRELLSTLQPRDRVAVVSFDSHLKLWQDFGEDLAATHAAIDRAMLFSRETEVAPAAPHSLARHFDRAAALRAASPERALELVARALEPLPGEKTVIFLGWGMGRYDASGVRMTPAFESAVRALRAARASVFVLDVTSADGHSLAAGLENVAAATGGLYFSTFRLPGLATDTLARAISGYYVLTLDGGALDDREGRIRIELRDRSGTVLPLPMALR